VKAGIVDLRRRTREILRALERNESVTILYRGKEKGVIQPSRPGRTQARLVREHPAFGMWRDRGEMRDVRQVVRDLRRGRAHDV
jgi:hypothetical protein